jgi:thiol:disulfide interchange protein DsbA
MKNLLVAAVFAVLVAPFGAVHAQALVAGRDYVEIPNGTPLDAAPAGTVVVEEYFNYICPACNAFEPLFVAWQAKLPPYVKLVHIPATFRADFVPYARAYYAAEAHGLAEQTHRAVYQAIHVQHSIPAEGDRIDEDKIASFYAGYGVSKEQFLGTMKSFGVELKVRRATEKMKQSRIPSTPSVVVNGRYLVRGDTYQDMLRIASALIEQEHGG